MCWDQQIFYLLIQQLVRLKATASGGGHRNSWDKQYGGLYRFKIYDTT